MKLSDPVYCLNRILKILFTTMLIFILYTDITYPQFMHWRRLNISDVNDVASTSSGDLYASSLWSHTLYKSDDGGDSWSTIHYSISVEKIETYGSDTLFLGTSEGYLIYSGDGGNSFNQLHSFGSKIYAIKFVKYGDSTLTIVGTANGKVHVSKDFGNSWNTQQVSTGYITSLNMFNSIIYAGTSKGLFISNDLGQNWQNIIIAVPDELVYDIEKDQYDNIYASAGFKIYISTDFGNSWNLSLGGLQFISRIRFSPEEEIFGGPFRSTDQGNSWVKTIPVSIIEDIDFKDSVTFMVDDDGLVYREELHPYMGNNYYPLTKGNKWQYTYYSYSGDIFGEVERNYSIKTYKVEGDTIINGKIFFRVGTQLLRYGDDNRLYKWQNSAESMIMDFNLIWGESFEYGGSTVYINEGYSNLFGEERYYKGFRTYYGTNGDELFSYVDSLGLNYHEASDGWYVFIQGFELRLIDALIQFNDSLYYFSDHYKPQISFTPIDSTDTLIVNLNFNVGHQYTKFSTTGTSRNFIKDVWLEYYYSKEDSSTNKDSLNCTISEYSTDCWVTILLDSVRVIDGYKFNYAIYARDKALMPEISRSPETGYYQLEYEQEPAGINEKKNNMYSFALSQNYPNPFNPTTMIQYAIGSRQFVSLKVYDVLGNEVAKLVNDDRPAGSYTVEFNGSNLASGIYFYQLKAGSYTATRKLILLK